MLENLRIVKQLFFNDIVICYEKSAFHQLNVVNHYHTVDATVRILFGNKLPRQVGLGQRMTNILWPGRRNVLYVPKT